LKIKIYSIGECVVEITNLYGNKFSQLFAQNTQNILLLGIDWCLFNYSTANNKKS
tara:strand:+ start:94 stop:258 length:165 start_codon:yes stop_codon:yes gene_type:complete